MDGPTPGHGVPRAVLLGAESTGTTSLTQALAAHLGIPCTHEFLRDVCARKAAENGGSFVDLVWTTEDFDEVADGQDALEEAAVAAHPGRPELLACDTDALATALWHRRYLGCTPTRFLRRAAQNPPQLYILTSPDGVEFEQDGWRDGEHVRLEMHGWFRTTLTAQPTPWIEVVGSPEERLDQVLVALRCAGR
ncbi:ATP-binding protein [Iamia sp. SCSIO 61187]|uniref:AAA family ATPase n=1 Tax=Iamia sp. SCSIO 61187 TaxID=2722752 RepID=UPI001C630A2D|nr:ATP-binding protein [Iamia sp. SCSIO 61187]QYG93654.1 ATP-binding protein [Iamia sp. SCSIO 61187]